MVTSKCWLHVLQGLWPRQWLEPSVAQSQDDDGQSCQRNQASQTVISAMRSVHGGFKGSSWWSNGDGLFHTSAECTKTVDWRTDCKGKGTQKSIEGKRIPNPLSDASPTHSRSLARTSWTTADCFTICWSPTCTCWDSWTIANWWWRTCFKRRSHPNLPSTWLWRCSRQTYAGI